MSWEVCVAEDGGQAGEGLEGSSVPEKEKGLQRLIAPRALTLQIILANSNSGLRKILISIP